MNYIFKNSAAALLRRSNDKIENTSQKEREAIDIAKIARIYGECLPNYEREIFK